MAKVSLSVLDRLKERPNGKFIAVTTITPTPLGEGKTVTSLGLGQALARLGKRAINTLRQPSKGPLFGIKGGACGGGYSQALPMENINLHFTGDIYAVESAHNLCAAAIDSSIFFGNKLGIDPENITWRRCLDINDRALRGVIIGLGGEKSKKSGWGWRGRENGYPRRSGFDITAATETAAIHSLATGLTDLRERLGRVVIGFSNDGKPITAEDLRVAGAMTVLMKDAIKPNLVQSTENTPVIIHGFPFANVGHGNNSILADMMALKLADYVVTESGFGSDCGAEKLIDIKCRQGGLKLDCALMVVTVRALKMHGGALSLRPGQPYSQVEELAQSENMAALERGCENLRVHLENVMSFGIPVVVALNMFASDRDKEVELVLKRAMDYGAFCASPVEAWSKGGAGCIRAAEAVIRASETDNGFHFLYPQDAPIRDKVETIATRIYRAQGVDYSPQAEQRLKLFEELGYDNLGVNVAKTHLSLSHDPNLKGVPRNFRMLVSDIQAMVGAGFISPIMGTVYAMPGLPSVPGFTAIDIEPETGRTMGLF
jgi:formate--tetrahydrofolate ligase